MASEFEPVVRTEETPEARIVIFELPGFRKEDLKVQICDQGNLIISGERGVKEMEERTKVGGRLEKMQNGGNRFRKVIGVPENVNSDATTAKLKDQVLRVSLPFVEKNQASPTEDVVNGGGKPTVADLWEKSKPDERSSPVKQQGLMQERPPAPQNEQGARLPEMIASDGCTEKASPGADERKGSLEEKKREAHKHAQDFDNGEPSIPTPTECCLPSPADKFPEKLIRIPSSTKPSLFSSPRVLIESTLLILCAGMYFSYILRSRTAD